jgi:dihydropyrimidinase
MSNKIDDIQIKGGVLVNSSELKLADVFIRGGVIQSVEPPNSGKAANQVIDATGKLVLPGIVEAHLHPVYADRLDTLSKSAVYGGITTLIPYIGAVKAWGVEGNLWDAVNYFIDSKDLRTWSTVLQGIHGLQEKGHVSCGQRNFEDLEYIEGQRRPVLCSCREW